MARAILIAAAALVMGGLMFILMVMSDPVDRCLDRGGRWNQALKRCEGCRGCPPVSDSLAAR